MESKPSDYTLYILGKFRDMHEEIGHSKTYRFIGGYSLLDEYCRDLDAFKFLKEEIPYQFFKFVEKSKKEKQGMMPSNIPPPLEF